MRFIRFSGAITGILVSVMLLGCGDTYRPVVNPFPTPGGDPQLQSLVFVGNQGVKNPPPEGTLGPGIPCVAADGCSGSSTAIDVPGDINLGNIVVGENPWSAVLVNGTTLLIADRDSNDVFMYYPTLSSTTSFRISMPLTVNAYVDSLNTTPITLAPVNFINAATISSSQSFATMPACKTVTAGICTEIDPASPGVLAVVASNSFSSALLVGNNPVALVELPDASRVYVVNQGSGTVNVFGANDRARIANIAGFSGPTYALATPDSKFVFVLNRGNSSIGVISTASNSLILSPSFSAIPTPFVDLPQTNPMSYDAKKQRLWVVNPADNSVTVFDTSSLGASSPTMPVLATLPQCTSGSTAGTCLPAGSNPFSITALSDGSRAYVANAGSAGIAPSVYMIDGTSFRATPVSGYIGVTPRGIVSSSDSTKVYIVNHDPTVIPSPDPSAPAGSTIVVQQPGTNIITTSNNSLVRDTSGVPLTIPAPFQDIVNCTIDTPQPWLPGYSYIVNVPVVPRTSNGHAYRSITKGTTGTTEPSFCTTSGCTVTDGTVTWLEIGAPRNCPRQRPNFAVLGQ